MGALIQYFGVTAKRKRKNEAAAAALAKAVDSGEIVTESSSEILVEDLSPKPLEEAPAAPATPAPAPPAPAPAPAAPGAPAAPAAPAASTTTSPASAPASPKDYVGFWIIPRGKDTYAKLGIRGQYTINKKFKIDTLGGRFHRPALALLASWKTILKALPAYRDKMPKETRQYLKKNDITGIDGVLDQLEKSLLAMGAAYYIVDGSSGHIFLSGKRIPPYWDSLILELVKSLVGAPASFRVPTPLDIEVEHGGAATEKFELKDLYHFVGHHHIKYFSELRHEIRKLHAHAATTAPAPAPAAPAPTSTGTPPATAAAAPAAAAAATTPAGVTPAASPPVAPSPAPPAPSAPAAPALPSGLNWLSAHQNDPPLFWFAKNLESEVHSYLDGHWKAKTYTKDVEHAVLDSIRDYLDGQIDEIRDNVDKWQKGKSKTPSEIFKYIREQKAHISEIERVLQEWNDIFHSSKSPDWTNAKYAINLNEEVIPEGTNLQNLLMEVTFRKLMSLSQSNGDYVHGGLVKIGNSWVTDPRVKNRTQNSYFVVTKPPTFKPDADGFTKLDYNFKSKPDRSTTGMRQKGYIKFIPPGFMKRMLQKIGLFKSKGTQSWDSDVHVFCTCPDFKYRWHKVLADKGASHTPTGQNGEATNQRPNITNPSGKLSLCKHLIAMSGYLATTRADVSDYLTHKQNITPVAPNKPPKVTSGASVDAAS